MRWLFRDRYGVMLAGLVAIGLAVLTGFYFPMGSAAQTPAQEAEAPRTVSVNGVGEVETQPDSVLLQLGVETQAPTAGEAVSQNNAEMQSLVDSLEAAGIPSEDLQTTTFRISPRYEYDETRDNRTLVGYTVTNLVEVQSDDLENLGSLIDQSVEAGANTVENIRFTVSDTADLTDQARELAFQNARDKAEQLAGFAGATLGPVLAISESSSVPRTQTDFAQAAVVEESIPIQPGTQSIRVNINVTWELVTGEGESGSGEASVSISPSQGDPGTEVQLTAEGLPSNTDVNIGFGEAESEYEVVQTANTGDEGNLSLEVTIPAFAADGEEYVVVVAEDVDDPDRFKVVSDRFEVTE